MAIDLNRIHKDLYEELEASDKASAEAVDLKSEEAWNTPQKKQERLKQTKAIAKVLVKVLTEYAEIVIPEHEPNSAMTGPAPGPGLHSHSTNLPPITHKIGKIV